MKKFLLSALAFATMAPVMAEESAVEISAGADLVSSYVVRGLEQGQGAAFQPSVSMAVGGLTVGAWGSSAFDTSGAKELDFYAGYEFGNFYIGFTDYWWEGQGGSFFHGKSLNDGVMTHYGEVNLSYTICESFPLSLGVNTYVYGNDYKTNGDRAYSTYITAAYPFSVGSFDVDMGIGMVTYREGAYGIEADNSFITDVSLTVAREVKITENFSLPLFTQLVFSPAYDDTCFIFGMSFNL